MSPFPSSQNTLDINIDDQNINDLQKILVCIRKESECGDSALYDAFIFRNMSDQEIAVTSGTPAMCFFYSKHGYKL